MEIDDFFALLEKVDAINTIQGAVEMLAEVDAISDLDKKEREIIDEHITESVDISLIHTKFSSYISQRYGTKESK